MPGEEMFEAQIGHEVSCTRGKAIIIFRPVTSQLERLRLVLPFQAFDVETPQIPCCVGDVCCVRVQVLHRQRRDLGRSYF